MNKNNLKFIVCCANGAGSSMMMKMTLQKVLDKNGIKPAAIQHCALSEGKNSARNYDVVLTARNFVNMFADAEKAGTVVVGLKNIMSADEMETGLKEKGILD